MGKSAPHPSKLPSSFTISFGRLTVVAVGILRSQREVAAADAMRSKGCLCEIGAIVIAKAQ